MPDGGALLGELAAHARDAVARLAIEAARLARSGEPVSGAVAALRVVETTASSLGVAKLHLLTVAKAQATRSELDGERSVSDWFARATRLSRGAAAAQERVAETLGVLPEVADAVADGVLTLGHAGAVAQVMGGASERVREHLTNHVAEIVTAGQVLSVPQLRRKLIAEANALEAETADRSYLGVRARRFLRLTSRSGGVALEGFLDPVAGESLRTAIEAATARPGVDDDRTGEQRAADALVDLTDRVLSQGVAKRGAQLRPQITVLVREDTFLLLQWRRRLAAEGCDSATLTTDAFGRTGLDEPPPLAELLDGTLLPFAALDVLACDALVQRLVIDPAGEPLDLGRSERTYVDGARRAILTRDRHCQWPGCAMRAQWCEVHHLIRWADDGETTTPLGITLCSNHHHRVHEARLHITKDSTGFAFAYPDGRSIGRTTRIHDHLLVPQARAPGGGGLRRPEEPERVEMGSPHPDSGPPGAGQSGAGSRGGAGPPGVGLPGTGPPGVGPPGVGPPAKGPRGPGDGDPPEVDFPEGCPASLW